MDIISKNRALTATVIIFAILNIACLVMFWSASKHDKIPAPPPREVNSNEKNENNNNSGAKDRIIEELNLNQEQTKKLNSLFDKFNIDSKNIKDEIRKNHKSINESIADRQDTNGIQNRFNQLGAAKAKLDRLSYDFFNELYNLCDDKQKDNFKELFKEINKLISSRGSDTRKKDDRKENVRNDERKESREDRQGEDRKERKKDRRNDRDDGRRPERREDNR